MFGKNVKYKLAKWARICILMVSSIIDDLCDCLNRFEKSSSYSAKNLQANVANKMNSITGMDVGSQMLYASQ